MKKLACVPGLHLPTATGHEARTSVPGRSRDREEGEGEYETEQEPGSEDERPALVSRAEDERGRPRP